MRHYPKFSNLEQITLRSLEIGCCLAGYNDWTKQKHLEMNHVVTFKLPLDCVYWRGEREEMKIQISNASEIEMKFTRTEENIKNLEEDNDTIK